VQPKSEADLVADLALALPHIPIQFLFDNLENKEYNVKNKRAKCNRLPSIYDLKMVNRIWQKVEYPSEEFHLFGAYLDKRAGVAKAPATKNINAVVRIIMMSKKKEIQRLPKCLLWYEDNNVPSAVQSTADTYMWVTNWGGKNEEGHPHLISCPLPNDVMEYPTMVSLVNDECEQATNILNVHHDDPPGVATGVAVCVKGMSLAHTADSFGLRLAEWLEFMRALGAERVYAYDLNMADEGSSLGKIVDYYVQDGFLDLSPLSLSGSFPNWPEYQNIFLRHKVAVKRMHEMIPYNDCLYKNMYKYKYVAVLDLDEIIMPLREDDWPSMLSALEADPSFAKAKSFTFRNVYFMNEMEAEEEPAGFHVLRHLTRSAQHTKPGAFVKSISKTEHALVLHNHHPLKGLSEGEP